MHVHNFHYQAVVGAKIFGADMSSSVYVENKKKDVLFFGEGPTQESDDTTIRAEAKCSINFTESEKKICVKSAL